LPPGSPGARDSHANSSSLSSTPTEHFQSVLSRCRSAVATASEAVTGPGSGQREPVQSDAKCLEGYAVWLQEFADEFDEGSETRVRLEKQARVYEQAAAEAAASAGPANPLLDWALALKARGCEVLTALTKAGRIIMHTGLFDTGIFPKSCIADRAAKRGVHAAGELPTPLEGPCGDAWVCAWAWPWPAGGCVV
jgi:hypothetical protein